MNKEYIYIVKYRTRYDKNDIQYETSITCNNYKNALCQARKKFNKNSGYTVVSIKRY